MDAKPPRTYKIDAPHMKGDDVKSWQKEIKAEFAKLDISCPIVTDGDWGIASRSFNASLCHALGMIAGEVMEKGVTPELRIRIRNRKLTDSERIRFNSAELVDWRKRLRARYDSADVVRVHRPVTKIIEDSWGYHPPGHTGLDVITQADPVIFAMVKSRIFDVRKDGWWGANPSGKVSLGDGIIQMEVLESIGPFKKGYHIGYGHAEKAKVKVGDIVEAGDPVGHAGLAVAWHIHLMYNTGQTTKGVGNLDPRPILDYAVTHG